MVGVMLLWRRWWRGCGIVAVGCGVGGDLIVLLLPLVVVVMVVAVVVVTVVAVAVPVVLVVTLQQVCLFCTDPSPELCRMEWCQATTVQQYSTSMAFSMSFRFSFCRRSPLRLLACDCVRCRCQSTSIFFESVCATCAHVYIYIYVCAYEV